MHNAILVRKLQKNARRPKKNDSMSEGDVIKMHAGSPIFPHVEKTNSKQASIISSSLKYAGT